MTQLTLSNWEFEDDPENNRLIIRSLSTNEVYYLNEDGTTSIDANTVNGYDIQKNGTDGDGIINLKTN